MSRRCSEQEDEEACAGRSRPSAFKRLTRDYAQERRLVSLYRPLVSALFARGEGLCVVAGLLPETYYLCHFLVLSRREVGPLGPCYKSFLWRPQKSGVATKPSRL